MSTIFDKTFDTLHNFVSPSRKYIVLVEDKFNPGKKEISYTVILPEDVPNTSDMAVAKFHDDDYFDSEVIKCMPFEMYEEISNYLDYKIKKGKANPQFEIRFFVSYVGKDGKIGETSYDFNISEDAINFIEFEGIIKNMIFASKESYLASNKKE